jgi:exosortase/archaeosortase family protein
MPNWRSPSIQRLAGLKNPSSLALALKASALIVAVVALYFQDLRIIFTDALTNESTNYVLIIPVLFAYLVYRKRRMLRAAITVERGDYPENTRHFGALGGILLCATAIILYWYGSYTFTPLEYHALTLPFFAAGLTLVLFNLQTLRQAVFPIAFLAFLAPLPSEIIYRAGSTLSVVNSEASSAIVNTVGIHSTISGLSGTPAITITQANGTILPPFTVDIACSGIYSLISFLIFAAFIAFVVRDKLWKKATTFLIGFPLIYSLNIFRITVILLIGYQWGEELALNVFHFLGGWILIFLGTLVLLIISEKLFKTQIFTKKQTQSNCLNCNPYPPNQTEDFCLKCGKLTKYPQSEFRKIDGAKIVTIALAIILLMSIQVPVFALTQGPAQILTQTPTGQQGNTQIFPQIPNYTLQYIERQTEFEQLSGQDFSLIYGYMPQDPEKETIFVGLEIAGTTSPLHHWEYCLITGPQTQGYQPSVEQLDLRDIQILQNPSIIARYFAFKDNSDNQTELVLYWYENSIFTTNGTSQEKYVEISLIVYPNTPQDVPSMENELLPFATAIVNYWQPIKMWTAIAITLSRNGITLAEITIAFLTAIICFYTFETLKQRSANAIAYQKLSSQSKQVIDAIAEIKKPTKPTLQAIAKTYRSKTGLQIEEEDLLRRLSQTEKTGIIASTIANVQDDPTHIWKIEMTAKKGREHKRLDMWKQIKTPGSK